MFNDRSIDLCLVVVYSGHLGEAFGDESSLVSWWSGLGSRFKFERPSALD